MSEEHQNIVNNSLKTSSNSTEQQKQTTKIDIKINNKHSEKNVESCSTSKRQKISNEVHSNSISPDDNVNLKPKFLTMPTAAHYQDILFDEKNVSYCNFSNVHTKAIESVSTPNENSKSTELNPIQKLLDRASTLVTDQDSDEDEQQKKISTAKKLLFPNPVATSFPEIVDTLRNERRQEFCPIYQDETPEQIALRQKKQNPVGSLLAKRIRWDDLKRKREEEEKKAQMQYSYGPYGPIYANKQHQQSLSNSYERYYAPMTNQYEQMVQMARVQQEHSGFWPDYQQQLQLQNYEQLIQNSVQTQIQPYTYPYSVAYTNSTTETNITAPTSFSSVNQNSYYDSIMQPTQPPPPPPDEPYPY